VTEPGRFAIHLHPTTEITGIVAAVVMSRTSEKAKLELAILRTVSERSPQSVNRSNLLGSSAPRGDLELALGTTLTETERDWAYRAFDRMRNCGWIVSTRTEQPSPDDWVVITPSGLKALERNALDDLDAALREIDPHLDLVEIRRGMWSAFESGQPHSLAQSAHSARELIDQTLKLGAPDERVRADSSFRADASSSSGITRRMRLNLLMRVNRGTMSLSDLAVVEAAADLVLAVSNKVVAQAHSRTENDYDQVKTALTAAETALMALLLPSTERQASLSSGASG